MLFMFGILDFFYLADNFSLTINEIRQHDVLLILAAHIQPYDRGKSGRQQGGRVAHDATHLMRWILVYLLQGSRLIDIILVA
jgi:hypothetical protein